MPEEKYDEIDQKMEVKAGRKFFSKIGFVYLGSSLAIACVQAVALLIVERFFPQWLTDSTSTLLVSMLVMYLLAMPLMILIVKILDAKVTLPQHRMSLGQWLLAAIMCYGITYGANLVGTVVTTIIGFLKGSPIENVLDTVLLGSNMWVVGLFTVLCAPVYEEFIFRKLLIDRVAVYGEGVAVFLSGLIFGLFHGNLSQFFYTFCLGLFFGFIYVKTGRVRYTIGLHMVVNFLGSVLPMAIMKLAHYDEFMETMLIVQRDVMEGAARMQKLLPGMFLLAGYVLVILGTAVAGIVLLIVYRKRFRLVPGPVNIPKGKGFAVVIVNAGMILFCVYWIAQIVQQLLS